MLGLGNDVLMTNCTFTFAHLSTVLQDSIYETFIIEYVIPPPNLVVSQQQPGTI